MRLIHSFILLGPIERRRKTEVQAWTIMPLLTTLALPAQAFELCEADVSAHVANARSLVTAGTEQTKLDQLFRLVSPTLVCLENELAVVAQCIGKRILV